MDRPLRTDAFIEHAIDAHADAVLRLALNQLRSRADAADAVQDTFLALLESETLFEGEGHLRAWLLRVCANRCHDMQRSAWSRRVDSLDETASDLADDEQGTEDAALAELERHPVWDALAELPEDQRLVTHLRYVEGLGCEEIAELLGVPSATVRTRLHRARNRIRVRLIGDATPSAEMKPGRASARRPADAAPHAPPTIG